MEISSNEVLNRFSVGNILGEITKSTKNPALRKNSILKNPSDYIAGEENRLIPKTDYEILIDEINKPRIGLDKQMRGSKMVVLGELVVPRNVDKIYEIMKSIPGFKRFMTFNDVDNEALRQACYFITHRLVKTGEYVFRQGDESHHFYGIISGRISLRARIRQNIPEEKSDRPLNIFDNIFRTSVSILRRDKKKSLYLQDEEEIICLNGGYCFGEWGLIYKKPRVTSAMAVEETNLFVLDEVAFNASLSKSLTKAEADRKNFFLNRIKTFADLQYLKFDSIFKTFVPMFLTNNQVIYLENTPSDKIFVVYMGSCSLQKNVNILPVEYKNDTHKMKFVTILKIEKGDITGLDALYEKNYKFTLRSDSDYTVVFSIRVDKLEEALKNKMAECFQHVYKNFDHNVNDIMDRKRKLALKNKLNYRADVIQKGIKNLKPNFDGVANMDHVVQEKIDEVLLNRKIMPTNNFNSFKVKSSNIGNNSNICNIKPTKPDAYINSHDKSVMPSSKNILLESSKQNRFMPMQSTEPLKLRISTTCTSFYKPDSECVSPMFQMLSIDNNSVYSPIYSNYTTVKIVDNIDKQRDNTIMTTDHRRESTKDSINSPYKSLSLVRMNSEMGTSKRGQLKINTVSRNVKFNIPKTPFLITEVALSKDNSHHRMVSNISIEKGKHSSTPPTTVKRGKVPLSASLINPENIKIYARETVNLQSSVKNNIIKWKNVVTSDQKYFNTGLYNIPLIGMLKNK